VGGEKWRHCGRRREEAYRLCTDGRANDERQDVGGGQRVMEGLSAFWSGVGLRCMENNKRPISNASAVDGSIAGRAAP